MVRLIVYSLTACLMSHTRSQTKCICVVVHDWLSSDWLILDCCLHIDTTDLGVDEPVTGVTRLAVVTLPAAQAVRHALHGDVLDHHHHHHHHHLNGDVLEPRQRRVAHPAAEVLEVPEPGNTLDRKYKISKRQKCLRCQSLDRICT